VSSEILDAAVFHHQQVPVHAHDHPAHAADHLFVEFSNVLTLLDRPEWQLILGGRGSGKTHLLRAFEERSRAGALNDRTADHGMRALPIYIDVTTFRTMHRTRDEHDRARELFRAFLGRLGEQLIVAITALESKQRVAAILRRAGRRDAAARARRTVREILAVVDDAPFVYDRHTTTLEEQQTKRERRGVGMRVRARVGLSWVVDLLSAESRIGGWAHRRRDEDRLRRLKQVGEASSDPRWPQIRQLMEHLCADLGIERIDVLVDNWTALDNDGTSLVQPYFAELMKNSLSGTPAISVKLAADGLATRLWDSRRRCGLQIPHHIEPAVNLNLPILDDAQLVQFFEWVMFRRMYKHEDRLKLFVDRSAPGAPLTPAFIESIFDARDTFELLVRGTEGRPRLFLQCWRRIAHAANYSVEPLWSQSMVLDIVRSRTQHAAQDLRYQSPGVQMLLTDIKPHVVARNDPSFAVEKYDRKSRKRDLKELLDKQLLHREPTDRSHRKGGVAIYRVSDDLMAEWARARAFEQELQELLGGPPQSGPPSLEDLVVKLEAEPPY
jgi:hypothetical protein